MLKRPYKRCCRRSVGIATSYGLDDRGSNPGRNRRFCFSPKRPEWPWGPLNFPFSRYKGHFPLVKRLLHEVNLSPPSSAEVKNEWSHTSSSLYAITAWVFIQCLRCIESEHRNALIPYQTEQYVCACVCLWK
jgi:hypothetical protein